MGREAPRLGELWAKGTRHTGKAHPHGAGSLGLSAWESTSSPAPQPGGRRLSGNWFMPLLSPAFCCPGRDTCLSGT